MTIDLVDLFPDLKKDGYLRTSPPTPDYNCVAWVFDDTNRWWEPDPFGFCFWPTGVRRTYAVENYVEVCEFHGYTMCSDGNLENGFEKVAIYTSVTGFRHIAKQVADGRWTSKLGSMGDITHSLGGVAGTNYGRAAVFMRRQTTDA